MSVTFSDKDIQYILQDFPKFELSYENMIHKKVLNSDIILAVPDGKRCFAWFSSYKEDLVCFILELTDDNRIKNINIILTSFHDKLALGTIFYGTVFNYNGINCFSIEDLYFYKGKSYKNTGYSEKLNTIKYILKHEMSQNVLTNKYTVFGLPFISNNFYSLLREIELLPYKISYIKFRFFEKNNSRKIVFIKYFKPGSGSNQNNSNQKMNNQLLNKVVFKITADIEPDIYNLFMYKNGKEEYYDVAHIPDYKTSVMMNKLFRNIKENDNLDRLEESDNEDEFENEKEDKYVYLDRSFKIICEYNPRFRKWCPVNIALKTDRIVTPSQLPIPNKNY